MSPFAWSGLLTVLVVVACSVVSTIGAVTCPQGTTLGQNQWYPYDKSPSVPGGSMYYAVGFQVQSTVYSVNINSFNLGYNTLGSGTDVGMWAFFANADDHNFTQPGLQLTGWAVLTSSYAANSSTGVGSSASSVPTLAPGLYWFALQPNANISWVYQENASQDSTRPITMGSWSSSADLSSWENLGGDNHTTLPFFALWGCVNMSAPTPSQTPSSSPSLSPSPSSLPSQAPASCSGSTRLGSDEWFPYDNYPIVPGGSVYYAVGFEVKEVYSATITSFSLAFHTEGDGTNVASYAVFANADGNQQFTRPGASILSWNNVISIYSAGSWTGVGSSSGNIPALAPGFYWFALNPDANISLIYGEDTNQDLTMPIALRRWSRSNDSMNSWESLDGSNHTTLPYLTLWGCVNMTAPTPSPSPMPSASPSPSRWSPPSTTASASPSPSVFAPLPNPSKEAATSNSAPFGSGNVAWVVAMGVILLLAVA